MTINNQYMTNTSPNPGLGHVPSYQVSGIPFASASCTVPVISAEPLRIDFPYVTKSYTVQNLGTEHIRVSWSKNGSKSGNAQYILVLTGSSMTHDVRVGYIFLRSDAASAGLAQVFADLTTIPATTLTFSGSQAGSLMPNWTGSIGVG
jgi:hypothetical protein